MTRSRRRLVVLADGPDLAPPAVAFVRESWEQDGGEVVAASYDGIRGHPLLIARSAWASIPDEGLRGLPVRLVACDAFGSPGDVDRPERPARAVALGLGQTTGLSPLVRSCASRSINPGGIRSVQERRMYVRSDSSKR